MIRSCIFLLLLVVQRFSCLNCPDLYVPVESDKICIHMTSRQMALKDLPEYCKDEAQGGVPLNRRFTDEGLKEVERIIKSLVESVFPEKVYIGMKRKESQYGASKPSDEFIYENGEGSVKDGDYPLWNDKSDIYDCGMVNYKKNFTVMHASCSESTFFICEKNEMPCEASGGARYLMYHGRCLYLVPAKDYYYEAAKGVCDSLKGHVAPYKSWKDSRIAEVILNDLSLYGGLYAALKKTEAGEWEYDSGEKETSRWDPDDEREGDCGVYRLVQDFSFGLYTMPCDLQPRGLCQYEGDV